MNNQTFTQPITISNFRLASPEAGAQPEQLLYASSRDYGFDFDEDELAGEILASFPACDTDRPDPAVDADEFCTLWFLS